MKNHPSVERFRADRAKAERLRADGATLAELSARYGISSQSVHRIFVEEWGYSLLKNSGPRAGRPEVKALPDFSPGKKYRIGKEEYLFLGNMRCEAGHLWIFRAQVGWKVTFTYPQLVGEEVRAA